VTLAWVLNLDAEDELAAPGGATARATAERVRALAPRTGLVAPDDVLLDGARRADGLAARAWMPTPRAVATALAAGALLPPGPPIEVLRRVNHRAFAAALGPPLPGAIFASTLDEVAAAVAGDAPAGTWLLKRPFSFAGRGRLAAPAGPLTPDATAFVTTSLRRFGGLTVEPLVARTADYALHGHQDREGHAVFGEPTRQLCDERGAWRATERAPASDLTGAERSTLADAAARAAAALHRAGYFGPFGVDAFRWTDSAGRARFHPMCELNARYTMGWATGMGDRRPDREPSG
jgi:hypothetical protein